MTASSAAAGDAATARNGRASLRHDQGACQRALPEFNLLFEFGPYNFSGPFSADRAVRGLWIGGTSERVEVAVLGSAQDQPRISHAFTWKEGGYRGPEPAVRHRREAGRNLADAWRGSLSADAPSRRVAFERSVAKVTAATVAVERRHRLPGQHASASKSRHLTWTWQSRTVSQDCRRGCIGASRRPAPIPTANRTAVRRSACPSPSDAASRFPTPCAQARP
jgi:hypothetical protein